MEHEIFWYIYRQPLYVIALAIVLMVATWTLLGKFLHGRRIWAVLNRVIVIISICTICCLTLHRNERETGELILIPFYSFVEMKVQPEIGRQMLMNLFMFVPLGLSAPFAIADIVKNRSRTILFSIGFAFGSSLLIECMQYFLKLGLCEVDDVITNTLGAVIGGIPYMIASLCRWNRAD